MGEPLRCAAVLVLFCEVVLVVVISVVQEEGAEVKETKAEEREAEEEERARREREGREAQVEREAVREEELGPVFSKKSSLASLTTRQEEKMWTKES